MSRTASTDRIPGDPDPADAVSPTEEAGPGRASPIAVAALGLVGDRATPSELVERFGHGGAQVDLAVVESALAELAALGLVRVALPGDGGAQYVPTSLGAQVLERGLLGESATSLAELERLRTDLLATIAHELRTPLTAVRTSAGLLLDPSARPTQAQRRSMLETIERNAERMQRLVADILDLARFRSGAIRLQLRPFDAVALVEQAVTAIRPLAIRRGQRIDQVTPPEGQTVFGDHRRLEQALLNLVSNAQRFAPEGGRIAIALETRPDGTVVWSVTDDGPGIPPGDQARLFERFFVGRNDRNGARDGVGLGLPTALAIAQAHGGTIEVDSRPGAGSTFRLVVPALGPADASPEEE